MERSPVFILSAVKSFKQQTPSDLHFRMICPNPGCRVDQRDGDEGRDRKENVQLSRQKKLQAWTRAGAEELMRDRQI